MDFLEKAFASIIAALIWGVFAAFPFMWLWNWLMPEIFGIVKIDFWQASGLIVLTGVLFNRNGSND